MNRTFQGILVATVPVVLGLAFTVGILKLDANGFVTKLDTATNAVPATASATGGSTATSVAFDAKAFVKNTCESCHGADLTGAYGPNLHVKAKELTVEQITEVLKNGKNGKMPAGLAKGHEEDVAKYIKSLATAS